MSLLILKQKIPELYDTFINDTIDAFKIAEVKNLLWVLQPRNNEGKGQIEILCEFFGRDVEERALNGKWNRSYLLEKKANIYSAVEIILQMGYVA
ncbi:MAG: hypothetical protein HZA12_07580 [Nitrospirae bacterium]|nr:hypothetical protein [Nitrospirota bacterium]